MIVAPSVLSLDYSDTKGQIEALNDSKAEWIHYDVMDGHFVPNITFGPDILKAFCRSSSLVKDVHLMVSDPEYYSDIFIDAGADIVTFHYEALDSEEKIHNLFDKIHKRGKKAGISIRPHTDVSVLQPFLNEADLILVMSVEPGFGGQKFQEEAPGRIAAIKDMCTKAGSKALLEVDGGINLETGKLCADAGVDVLVAGSYIFKNDIRKAVASLCAL